MVKELYTIQIWEFRTWSSNLSNNLWWMYSLRDIVQLWHFGNYSPCWELPKRKLERIHQVFKWGCWHRVARIWRVNISFLRFTNRACSFNACVIFWKIAGDTKFANTSTLSRPSGGTTATIFLRLIVSNEVILSLFESVSRPSGRSILSIEIADYYYYYFFMQRRRLPFKLKVLIS